MEYSRYPDAELVNLFLNNKAEQADIRNEFFGRYYERFDQRIRGVLYTCGLPYSPSEFYYNKIFLDAYQQIFELKEFERTLQKYELTRGEFANWFLNYVVVNRIKDWLKKIDKASGRKNIEWLKERIIQEQQQISLNESFGKEGNKLTLTEIITAKTEQYDETHQQAISSAIQQLPSAQQLMLGLLFLAYQETPEHNLAYLAAELSMPTSTIKEQLKQISQELKKSPKYEQSERVELSLACLEQQENYLHNKLKHIESEIEVLFPDKEIPRMDAKTQPLFKDIAQAKQELLRAYRNHQIEAREYCFSSLLLQYQNIVKQLSKITRKRADLAQEYNSGKYFVFPSYKQLAKLLNISEGTLASRINRTVNQLRKLLPLEESGGKIRIRKVEDIYQRDEEYAQ
jgi:DNA-directed RNA polymerase specialized sigma24 family protein